MFQISYLSTNGASKGNYFLPKTHKLTVFKEKTGFQKQLWQPNVQILFFSNGFWFWLDERKSFCVKRLLCYDSPLPFPRIWSLILNILWKITELFLINDLNGIKKNNEVPTF